MVLLGVTIIVSSIVYLSPVDPAALTFGQRMDDATLVKTRKEMGLDNSLPIQVLTYVRDVSPLFVGPASHWQEHYDGVNMSIVTWVI
jgi:ABC-type dipeptide/oligopeptide/nickel transport systems, permease components